jgi:hypothetical protein
MPVPNGASDNKASVNAARRRNQPLQYSSFAGIKQNILSVLSSG